MLAPRTVKFEAQKRKGENLEIRIFLKWNADEKQLDEQFNMLTTIKCIDKEGRYPVSCKATIIKENNDV